MSPQPDAPEPDEQPARPLLRVVTRDATPEEVAALVAVLAALDAGAAPAPRPRPAWQHPGRRHRVGLAHGPGGWRGSALPR